MLLVALAARSLGLLSRALPGASALYPPLFSEEVFGSIVGMFELNNLSVSVPSPVEDYFLLIDDLETVGLGIQQSFLTASGSE